MVTGVKNGSKLLVVMAFLLTIFLTNTSVKAAANSIESPQFGIRPAAVGTTTTSKGYFILKGQPGETISDAVIVSNPGTVPVKLVLYSVDAVNGQQGGISYLSQMANPTDVGAWVALGSTTVELPPNKQLTVPFKLSIPQNALSGQHLGGIAAQLVNDSEPVTTGNDQNVASLGVKTVTRTLTAVQISVGDAVAMPSLAINGVKMIQSNGQNNLALDLQNTGNSLIQPKGEVTLADSTGKVVLDTPVALTNILPRNSISYPVVTGQLVAGTYKVHASLDFGGNSLAVYDGPVEVKADNVKPTSVPSISRTLPGAGPIEAAINNEKAAPASDNNSMLVGILIGVVALLGLSTFGMGSYILLKRGKKRG